MNAHSQSFSIWGMTCGSCAEKIQQRLGSHPEIESVTVTLQPPQAIAQVKRHLATGEMNQWLAPLGRYQVIEETLPAAPTPADVTSYRPLLIILLYLLLVTGACLVSAGQWDVKLAMQLFMGGFFITFSFFKMLDLQGFAKAYRSYDLVAKAWPRYGLIYPFIELGLGLGYLTHFQPCFIHSVTAVVMAVSLAGVLQAVLSKQAIRCACLGTMFQLPMSTVTILEDSLMLGMALIMLKM